MLSNYNVIFQHHYDYPSISLTYILSLHDRVIYQGRAQRGGGQRGPDPPPPPLSTPLHFPGISGISPEPPYFSKLYPLTESCARPCI